MKILEFKKPDKPEPKDDNARLCMVTDDRFSVCADLQVLCDVVNNDFGDLGQLTDDEITVIRIMMAEYLFNFGVPKL